MKREQKKRMTKEARRKVFRRLVQVLDSVNATDASTDSAIAGAIGVSRSLLSKWRGGTSDPLGAPLPTSDVLAAFAEEFDVSAEWILTGHGPERRTALVQHGALEEMLEERLGLALRAAGLPSYRITGAALLDRLVETAKSEARARKAWADEQTLRQVIATVRERLPERARETGVTEADVYLTGNVVGAMLAAEPTPPPPAVILDPVEPTP
ncbi:MAG: hypothetical protein MUE41_04125 [Gemmatimonadaceae bacterium]|jgi:transcriptional regulator with XRE-family HTH domain|nr:hypothetical protein [Gemmatimonadaceae bacterium]